MKTKRELVGALTTRQKKILKLIVEEYIERATPVSSKKIQELYDIEISTATLRNECMVLEEFGFLEKTYNVSGRIPSTTGYRYYVDKLMGTHDIKDIKSKINEIFDQREESIDKLLDEASSLISEITNLAVIVSTREKSDELKLIKIELIPINDESAIMIIVLSNGEIQNETINFKDKMSIDDLKTSIRILNERLKNTNLSEINFKLESVIPIIKTQVKKYEFILKTFVDKIVFDNTYNNSTKGMSNLMKNQEFNNPQMVKKVLEIIENTSLLNWFDNNVNKSEKLLFKIGVETGLSDDITMVQKNIKLLPGKETTLSAIGPKRLHYELINEVIELISDKLKEKYEIITKEDEDG